MCDPDKAQKVVRKSRKPKVPKHLLDGHDPKDKLCIKASKNRYQLLEVLGHGGFGVVYKVSQMETREEFALKTENGTEASRKHSRLKIEMNVLRTVNESREPIRKRHFAKIVDRGRTTEFKFIVMELVGQSLAMLQKAKKNGRFDPLTAAYLAYQTAEAIDALHYFGFIHRDIKPQNFSLNYGETPRTVYLLDFGIARPYVDQKTKVLMIPRKNVKFVGSPNYASITGLCQKEQGRRDDYESWFYMSVEFLNPDLFTWLQVDSLAKLIEAKIEFMTKDALCQSLPKQYILIRNYIMKLKYENNVDTDYIKRLLIKSQKLRSIMECIMFSKNGQLGVIKCPIRVRAVILMWYKILSEVSRGGGRLKGADGELHADDHDERIDARGDEDGGRTGYYGHNEDVDR
ncbi:hypothetical protein L596_020242 [Steinernema carpocapsae]|uniref:Protein kinase domain-containing protein n=1 Tax=Steinernema carpocapsae TaxID=34508 RepID=A0A4U5MSX9_STECR|nr:hypothetical protein L596_020242 [Steinernema carpocapsae]